MSTLFRCALDSLVSHSSRSKNISRIRNTWTNRPLQPSEYVKFMVNVLCRSRTLQCAQAHHHRTSTSASSASSPHTISQCTQNQIRLIALASSAYSVHTDHRHTPHNIVSISDSISTISTTIADAICKLEVYQFIINIVTGSFNHHDGCNLGFRYMWCSFVGLVLMMSLLWSCWTDICISFAIWTICAVSRLRFQRKSKNFCGPKHLKHFNRWTFCASFKLQSCKRMDVAHLPHLTKRNE